MIGSAVDASACQTVARLSAAGASLDQRINGQQQTKLPYFPLLAPGPEYTQGPTRTKILPLDLLNGIQEVVGSISVWLHQPFQ